MNDRPTLVAHRGYPTQFPENTLIGYRAAIRAGTRWVETDVQLTRDRAVVLYHDATLQRISGVTGGVLEHTLAELRDIPAAHRELFGDRFAHEPIATLQQFAELIRDHSDVQAMVELKQESIDGFGVDEVVRRTHELLESIASQCVLISKNTDALLWARREHGWRIGWVLPVWNDAAREFAVGHAPEFMICKVKRFPAAAQDIWQGPWEWMIYNIDDPDEALRQRARGISFVETNTIGELLQDARLRP